MDETDKRLSFEFAVLVGRCDAWKGRMSLRYSAVSWVVGDVLVPEVPMKRRFVRSVFRISALSIAPPPAATLAEFRHEAARLSAEVSQPAPARLQVPSGF
ncbi:hypothetical protein AK812_SmicGene1599 [Symbiodinium microadriaticum]|uniref:Uncharacterized protein n=1 Tax=Symbiodinium microadriaticum TaxID=2951 RepID=A0A1Q9F3K0_SYMMI|nr:hypothetical protein AK812_SmicGene1599 [Symbiodinium microadriaticum]